MASFKDRIKQLRTDRNLTLGEMGKLLNKSESTISLYEAGKREPKKSDDYVFIANTFNVSLDYLMGRTDLPECKVLTNKDLPFETKHDIKVDVQKDAVITKELLDDIFEFMKKSGYEVKRTD